MSGQLERLLEQATPDSGPECDWTGESGEHFARLIALAPDLARLLVDAMAWIDPILTKPYRVEERWKEGNELLARFAELEQRAGEGQA